VERGTARIDPRGLVAVDDQELVRLHAVVAAHEIVEGDAQMALAAEQFGGHPFPCMHGGDSRVFSRSELPRNRRAAMHHADRLK